jgi:hypothetical protein
MKKLIIGILAIGSMASCSMTRPYTATNNPIGAKVGKSETKIIFGASQGDQLAVGLIVTNKNFGVIEAAKKGKIDKIATVDVKTTNFYIFQKVEIIVTGE